MKRLLLSIVVLLLGAAAFSQVPALYYDFELNTSRGSFENAVEQAINTGNSVFSSKGVSNIGQASGAGSLYSGSNGRGLGVNGWSKNPIDPGVAASEYIEFTANTSGLKGLSLDVDCQQAGSGSPSQLGVIWSVDGVTFYPAILLLNSLTTSWKTLSFPLGILAENKPSVVVRIYGYNGVNASHFLNFDNITLKATTLSGVKSLFDFDDYGMSLTSSTTAAIPTFNTLTITASGTVVSLNSKLKLAIGLFITDNAVFSCGENAKLQGNSAQVVIENGCVLRTSSLDSKGAIKGNLGSNLLLLNPLATIEYIGSAQQYQDNFVLANVIVNNANGVIHSGDVSVAGNLILKKGTLKPGAHKLSVKGNISKTDGSIDASDAEVVFEGSSTQSIANGVFAGNIKSLTVNNIAGVNFDTDATITEAIGLSKGDLNIGSKKLTIRGAINRNGLTELGTIDASNGTLEFSGALAQAVPDGTFKNNKVKSLRISNTHTAGVSLNTATEVTDVLDFGAVNNAKLKTNGKLSLKSNAAGTARVGDLTNGGTNTGNEVEGDVSVERFSPAWSSRRYRLMTSPVMNTTINEAWQEGAKWNGIGVQPAGFGTLITGQQQGTASNANNKGFDYWSAIANSSASVKIYVPGSNGQPGSWQSITSTTTPNAFDNHQAYLVFIRGDRSVFSGTTPGAATVRAKGKLKAGNFTVDVPVNQGHKLIGNPYASPLDLKQVYDANKTKIQPYFWIYQASLGTGTGGYVLVRPVSPGSNLYETIPGDGSKTAENRLVHSGEGFFVMPNPQATGVNTITIQEKFKSTSKPSVAVFRQEGAEPSKMYINLTTVDNGVTILVDGVMAQFDETNSGVNVAKSSNATENISILRNGSDLIVAANEVPGDGDTLKLRFWNVVTKEYQLEIKGLNFATAGLQPVLVDSYLSKETAINLNDETTVYSFRVTSDAASKNQQRFYIIYKLISVLPFIEISPRAELQNNSSAVVSWTVSDEKGVKSYELEKSSDAVQFESVATLEASKGAGLQTYSINDAQVNDVHYYRVKLTGTYGDTKYSSVVKVELDKRPAAVSIFPNPVRGNRFNIQLFNKPNGLYLVTLYGMDGQAYAAQAIQHGGGHSTHTLALRQSTPSGQYTLVISDEAGRKEVVMISIQK